MSSSAPRAPGSSARDADKLGVEVEFGCFGWATDPDSNRLELFEPAPGH